VLRVMLMVVMLMVMLMVMMVMLMVMKQSNIAERWSAVALEDISACGGW
jgi:hypothetical protein